MPGYQHLTGMIHNSQLQEQCSEHCHTNSDKVPQLLEPEKAGDLTDQVRIPYLTHDQKHC